MQNKEYKEAVGDLRRFLESLDVIDEIHSENDEDQCKEVQKDIHCIKCGMSYREDTPKIDGFSKCKKCGYVNINRPKVPGFWEYFIDFKDGGFVKAYNGYARHFFDRKDAEDYLKFCDINPDRVCIKALHVIY